MRIIKNKGTYIENNNGILKILNPKQKNNIEKKWYQQWWFISLITGVICSMFLGFNFSSLKIGIISFIIIFLIISMFNPERRFFRIAIVSLGMATIHLPFEMFLVKPEYGYINIGSLSIPWLGICFVILSGFLFFLDFKMNKS